MFDVFSMKYLKKILYAFNMSSDAQIYVSRRVCVLFSRPRVATLLLKIMQITCPAFQEHQMLSFFALFDW